MGPSQGSETRFHQQDQGLAPLVTASLTFGSGSVTGANGTFTPFGHFEQRTVLIEGTNLNNGEFLVTASNGPNFAFLALAPPPKAEGPVTATVRMP